MAYRGRGRGGRGRGGFGLEKRCVQSKPFVLFPEGVELPDIPKVSTEDQVLIKRKYLLESFSKGSCYYLTEDLLKSKPVYLRQERGNVAIVRGRETSSALDVFLFIFYILLQENQTEIERYSDTLKQDGHKRREKLTSYLKLTSFNFPPELVQGTKRIQHEQKKLRWDQDTYHKKLDFFENLENMESSKSDDAKEKKENSDNEDAYRPEEDDEETSDDGDYNQNVDFDDDDDDLNIDDEETEDVYE